MWGSLTLQLIVVKRIYRILGYLFVEINSNKHFAERIFENMRFCIQSYCVPVLHRAQPVQFTVCAVDYIVHVLSMSGKVLAASCMWSGTKSVSSPLDA